MGLQQHKNKKVTFVIEGVDELDVRLDDLESRFDDMLVLIKALSEEIAKLKAKKAPAKKAAAKKPAKKK